jgi:UDP-2,4-diacetamido-2,4,6-trideoxy-beta-L-altropyranose hydrolase
MKKIVFIANASSEIGTGHIMRCLTVANALKKYDFDITFIMQDLEGNLIDYVKAHSFKHSFDYIKADLYIIDSYTVDISIEKELRRFTKYIMVVDDLANREHDCDILLDPTIVSDYTTRYDSLVSQDCIKLLGAKYLILREEFIKARKTKKIKSIENLLVFMGGSDPTAETLKILKALEHFRFKNIDIVVGKSNQKKDEIRQICLDKKYNYYEQINNISDLMNKADFALGAGGITAWERAYVGLPSINTIVAQNQLKGTTYSGDIGTCINLGWHEDVTTQTYIDILNAITVEKLQKISNMGLEITKSKEPNSWLKSIMEILK